MLKPRQRRFVEEYLVDMNAKKAAIRAGYSESYAVSTAYSQLMRNPEVQKAIEAELAERAHRTHITADRVVQELSRIAFFDPRRLFAEDGSPLPIGELDADTAAAVSALDLRQQEDGVTLRLRVCDKLRALELLVRHLGMDRAADGEGEGAAGVVLLPPAVGDGAGAAGAACGEETEA